MIWSDRTIDPSTATDTRKSRLLRRLLPLAGAAAAVSLLLVPVGAAEPNNDVTVIRCAAKIMTNPPTYQFYPPGTKMTDVNGKRWVCGPDGNWFRDYSRIRDTATTLLAPRALAG